ncbi:MAG: hypothetical protein IKA79_05895 [Lentisphaeria bacterium]|nr:hypothetical protein [Lentisphaeria bacterium]
MKNLKKAHIVLIVVAVLILLACTGMTVCLLFSNYQNVRLFKQAESNFRRGDVESLSIAEAQLLQVVNNDGENEAAYIMLGHIAGKRKYYPEQVYYSFMAHRLNPLSEENKKKYIQSLCFARYFDRLENFLAQQESLPESWRQILLYAAGHNGNIKKYSLQFPRRDNNNPAGELALLLFEHKHLRNKDKLAALDRFPQNDLFLKQEILAAKAELFLADGELDNAEKMLQQACELNPFAFAPVLGRFYASFRTLGKAVTVFEKYLAVYHDPQVALQCAEIYCLLNRKDDIARLRTQFQADSGNLAMLYCYYFDALIALAENNMAALKELTVPLRSRIKTALAEFMFFCVALQENNLVSLRENYRALLARRNYPDLQKRADELLANYLKYSLANAKGNEEQLLPLAELLYRRRKDVFTAKFILLVQKKSDTVNAALLKEALKNYSKDQGIIKIAIEYYLKHELSESERLISYYKQVFPDKKKDMLRYEILLALQKKDLDLVSSLFRSNLSPDILPWYWYFASTHLRENDLIVLSKDKLYGPFCTALLLLKKGDRKAACALLETADAKGNPHLLFFAAKVLAENGKNQAALDKYIHFPQNSPYKLAVLLNMAELYAEKGDLDKALELSRQAYEQAPDLAETQLCYADKLYKKGNLALVPDIVKLSSSPYRRKMEELWIAGMQQRIKECDADKQREKVREMCRQLLVIAPDNHTALEYLKRLNKMPQ